MGLNILTTNFQVAIVLGVLTNSLALWTSPQPTSISLVYIRPESSFNIIEDPLSKVRISVLPLALVVFTAQKIFALVSRAFAVF